MTRERGRAGRSRERLLIGVVVFAGAAVLVAFLSLRQKSIEHEMPKQIQVTWTVRPVWGDRSPRPPRSGPATHDVAVYLDASQPMGGFLPPPGRRSETSGFREVVDAVKKHLVSVAGDGRAPQWFTVGAGVERKAEVPRVERGLFREHETRLDLALTRMTAAITDGGLAAAALVTDMNASGGLEGALGALAPLNRWIALDAVRAGTLHAGLLGVRASYWGVPGRTCPTGGDLGCWFSEQAGVYMPLHQVAQAAFYVLVLGRDRKAVQQIAERVRSDVAPLKLVTEWELLTAVSEERSATGFCQVSEPAAPGEAAAPQLTLSRESDGKWTCVQGNPVELHCALPDNTALDGPRIDLSWKPPAAALKVEAEEAAGKQVGAKSLSIALDCGRLREQPPKNALTIWLAGPLPADGGSGAGHWKDWTSENDSDEKNLGRTPQLAHLVDRIRLRPARIEVVSSPILLMSGSDEQR
jgi:hypothetical protein